LWWLSRQLQRDLSYAWTWHCNLAMAQYDALTDDWCKDVDSKTFLHLACNDGAARFMRAAFGVNTTACPEYAAMYRQLKGA